MGKYTPYLLLSTSSYLVCLALALVLLPIALLYSRSTGRPNLFQGGTGA